MGSLPTTNGKTATAKYGCLIVLDSEGKAVETIASKNIQGPWDSTAKSEGSKTTLFVSNALNGGAAKGIHTIDNSTVLRIELESGEGQTPKVLSETVIADGIPWVDSPKPSCSARPDSRSPPTGRCMWPRPTAARSSRSPKR